ncbi:hypothetical protein STEG23_005240, partial [Scotinomys teguina]
QIEQLLELLTTEVLNPDSQAPSGVKSHFLEIFLEELTKVGAAELTADQNLQFIHPFCQIAAHTKDSLVLNKITRSIFETIVEQAPLAIDDLMNELDKSGEGEASDGDDESSEGEQDLQDTPPKRLPAGSIHTADPEADKEQVWDDEENTGPVLQFDYEAVANRLFKLASRQSTPSQNRKRLYKVIQKLRDLAGGTFPEDEVPEKAYKKLLEGRRERKKKKKKRFPTLQPRSKTGPALAEASMDYTPWDIVEQPWALRGCQGIDIHVLSSQVLAYWTAQNLLFNDYSQKSTTYVSCSVSASQTPRLSHADSSTYVKPFCNPVKGVQ